MTSQQRTDDARPAVRAEEPPADSTGPDDELSRSKDGDGVPVEIPPRRRRRPLRTSLIVLAALVVAAAGGVAATGALGGESEGTAAPVPSAPGATADVARTTLTRTETVSGTLGYGDETVVRAPAAGGGQPSAQSGRTDQSGETSADSDGGGDGSEGDGVLTRLPAEGDVIERGESVYSVDEQKVPLLYGSTPLYRTLDVGADGSDVQMLEKNLAALGYTGFTADDEYTSGTAAAVEDWQGDLGREETGTVRPGDAVIASGARRVAEVAAAVGSAPSGELLSWTGTDRVVTVDLETQYEDLVEDGAEASVTLPDGTEVDATVTDVGNAATAEPSEGNESSGGGADEATLPVELAVGDQKKLGRYQAAPVDVTLAAESREDVLAVPVNALVARPGGGYAVQAVTGGGVEDRPVELGLFADGMVEISGDGVTEGLKVGIPQ